MTATIPERRNIQAALSLGGNVGDVAENFRKALAALDSHETIVVVARSSVWRTPPWGKTDQPDFLNMAALIETSLPPRDLLELCLSIERAAGRERSERWGPRTLDIDIIAYGDERIDEADLQLPHPRARQRAFVLVPLAEIAGEFLLDGQSISGLAARCDHSLMRRDEAATALIKRG